jgi:hypothetical protein
MIFYIILRDSDAVGFFSEGEEIGIIDFWTEMEGCEFSR